MRNKTIEFMLGGARWRLTNKEGYIKVEAITKEVKGKQIIQHTNVEFGTRKILEAERYIAAATRRKLSDVKEFTEDTELWQEKPKTSDNS